MKGLNQQQIDAISQIRYITHDCLRVQVGFASVAAAATSPADDKKRGRGKERVRRKTTVKRRRKDDMMQYHVASEDDQSQYCGSTVPVDQLNFLETQTEIDQFQLSHEAAMAETTQLDDTIDEATRTGLYEPTSYLSDEVNGSKPHDSSIGDLHPGDADTEDSQPTKQTCY